MKEQNDSMTAAGHPLPSPSWDWFYVPWSRLLILLTRAEFDELRTNRNRNVVPLDDQQELLTRSVAIAGLSIGANIAVSLARSGIGATLRLADFDVLASTNLNRAPYPFFAVGRPKTAAIRQALFDITPFLNVELIEEGVTASRVASFCDGQDLIFDEIDDLPMKLRIRQHCREAGIPVAMMTNLGDRLLIDVERYDLEPDLPYFNGRVPDIEDLDPAQGIEPGQENALAVRIVGPENVPTRVLGSIPEIGRTLVGRPQIASTSKSAAESPHWSRDRF